MLFKGVTARQIIESLFGPEAEEVNEVVSIIQSAQTWEEANEKLKPFRIRFSENSPYGSPGFDPATGITWLPARIFGTGQDWFTIIEHEFTHRDQMVRAWQRGGDLDRITASQNRHFFDKRGNLRMDRYKSHPLEMQALAKNAISKATKQGKDLEKMARSGQLRGYAPYPPGNRKRFGKYAYQMLNNRVT